MNIPAAGSYDKIQVKMDLNVKLRSPLPKAESRSFYEDSMRKSIEVPGAGNYSPRDDLLNGKGVPKWKGEIKNVKKRS